MGTHLGRTHVRCRGIKIWLLVVEQVGQLVMVFITIICYNYKQLQRRCNQTMMVVVVTGYFITLFITGEIFHYTIVIFSSRCPRSTYSQAKSSVKT